MVPQRALICWKRSMRHRNFSMRTLATTNHSGAAYRWETAGGLESAAVSGKCNDTPCEGRMPAAVSASVRGGSRECEGSAIGILCISGH